MATIEKRKKQADFSNLYELEMSKVDWEDFFNGIVLFNEGHFWRSHEFWEDIWKRHSENSRIFFQGLIQAAAGLRQLQRGVFHGADKHLQNALWKLKPFQPEYLTVDVAGFVVTLGKCHHELLRLGRKNIALIQGEFIPKIKILKSLQI